MLDTGFPNSSARDHQVRSSLFGLRQRGIKQFLEVLQLISAFNKQLYNASHLSFSIQLSSITQQILVEYTQRTEHLMRCNGWLQRR